IPLLSEESAGCSTVETKRLYRWTKRCRRVLAAHHLQECARDSCYGDAHPAKPTGPLPGRPKDALLAVSDPRQQRCSAEPVPQLSSREKASRRTRPDHKPISYDE